ncbi:MAG: hypothetical protein ABIH23_16740 [bacterium]
MRMVINLDALSERLHTLRLIAPMVNDPSHNDRLVTLIDWLERLRSLVESCGTVEVIKPRQ